MDILDGDERRRILQEWNDTAVVVADGSVPELVAVQAAVTPDAVAVVAGDAVVAYAGLEARAEPAGRVPGRRRGWGRSRWWRLLVPRAAELVAALLAVWKAGVAYLPVDLGLPAERIRFMLADSGAALMLTEGPAAGAAAEAAAGTGVRVVVVDEPADGARRLAGAARLAGGGRRITGMGWRM